MVVWGKIISGLVAILSYRRHEDTIASLVGENWTPEHLKKISDSGLGVGQCIYSLELSFEDAKAPDARYTVSYFREDRGWYIELMSAFNGSPESYEGVRNSLAESLKAKPVSSEPRMVDGQLRRVDVMVPIGNFGFGSIAFCMGIFYADFNDIQNPVMNARLHKASESAYQNAVKAGIPLKK